MSVQSEDKSFITFAITGLNGQSSEIQISANDLNIIPFLQKLQENNDDSKKREPLTRRPSYRKIYNELSLNTSVNTSPPVSSPTPSLVSPSNSQTPITLSMESPLLLKQATVPLSSQNPTNSPNKLVNNAVSFPLELQQAATMPAINMSDVLSANSLPLNQGNQNLQAALNNSSFFRYAQTADGTTVLIPVNLNTSNRPQTDTADNNTTFSSMTSTTGDNSSRLVQNEPLSSDDSSKKREVRLLKNREAARECRRKKKEYVRCLESRVSLLESQNNKLIEELQKFKSLCAKDVSAVLLAASSLNSSSSTPQMMTTSVSEASSSMDNNSIPLPITDLDIPPITSNSQINTELKIDAQYETDGELV